ncbi:MAG TPA: isoprenylcysteine carboxylmethyltransferase family protein [Pedococcus sp.]|jgi:protein-S-isoprenylcysteine O-methyltransferase Ste14|uniref:methyltransferase family protein n=1 Tax=Pedococcus sp. TaxID=2860345 RepID=UPI002F945912
MAPAGARVRTIPPLVFAIPLVVASLLHLVAPLPLPLSGARVWLGVVLVAAAVALMAWAVAAMRRAHTTVIPWEEVSRLVTEGPFRLSRNPIYLADALAYLGVTLLVGSWWPLLVLPAVLLAMLRLVISREEEYLAARFGADYAAYRSRVRRWV